MNRIAGVIVAGGAGTRAGGGKPLLPFGPGVLVDAVVAQVRPQVGTLALNIPAVDVETWRARYGPEFPLLPEAMRPAVGPLGGVLAGLEWAAAIGEVQWLASFPCDTPFLPADLVALLHASASEDAPVAAADSSQVHALCAIWPVSCARSLRNGIEAGRMRSVMSAIEGLNGKTVRIASDPDAFFNVNTTDDLAIAETIRTRRHIP